MTTAASIPQNLSDFIHQYNSYIANPSAYNASNNISMQTPQQASRQGLSGYLNTPEYALMYGQGNAATQQAAAQHGTYDPTQAFHNDPGFNFNIQQAYQQLQNRGAAQGLLQSGPMQQALLDYTSGLQNQQYQNFLQQNNSMFNSYQQQLGQLASAGTSPTNTGASLAGSNAQQLAGITGQGNLATGQQIGAGTLATGQNISQLLANQGSLGASAYLNTGAAQANAIMQGAFLQAQQQAANQNAANQGQNSLFQGQGAMAGFSGGGGNSGFQGYGSWGPPAANGNQTYTGNPWGSFQGMSF